MGALDGLQPESVFHFFEEISRIPHGSGNVGRISDYLKEFANRRALFCVQDSGKYRYRQGSRSRIRERGAVYFTGPHGYGSGDSAGI